MSRFFLLYTILAPDACTQRQVPDTPPRFSQGFRFLGDGTALPCRQARKGQSICRHTRKGYDDEINHPAFKRLGIRGQYIHIAVFQIPFLLCVQRRLFQHGHIPARNVDDAMRLSAMPSAFLRFVSTAFADAAFRAAAFAAIV